MATSNYVSQGFSGAATGASAGAVAGPWGALAGGALGLVGGLFSAAAEEEAAERRRELLEQAAQELNISYNEIEQAFGEFYQQYDLAKAYGYTDENGNVDLNKLGAVGQKIQNWDAQVNKRMADAGWGSIDPLTGEFVMNDVKFDYDKDVSDFMDPYMANVIQSSNKAVQHSAAGAGLGRSTGAAQAIAENTAKEYDKLYNTALTAYNQDRTQAYNEWSKVLDNSNQRLQTLLEADKWGLGQEKELTNDVMSLAGEEAKNMADVNRERAQTNAQIKLAGI
jgi:hypothetical protein